MESELTEGELREQQEKLWQAKVEAAEKKVAAVMEELAEEGLTVRIVHRIEILPLQRP